MDKLQILKGAEFAAEAKRRGLSLEQAVDLVMAQMQGEVEGVRQIRNNQLEEGDFGTQDALQNFLPGEEEKAQGGRDPNEYKKYEYKKDDEGNRRQIERQIILGEKQPLRDPQLREQELLRAYGLRVDNDGVNRGEVRRGAEILERFIGPLREGERRPGVKADSGGERRIRGRGGVEVKNERDLPRPVVAMKGAVAPAAQVMQQELDRLNEGINKFGADAFPGAADAAGRLEDQIRPNRDAERSLVREMVERDRLRQNSEVVEANNWRAQARANVIGQNFVVGGSGAAADQAIANIGQIAKIGHAKIAGDFQVSTNPRDLSSGTPTELPIDIPEMYNAPVTDNRFAGPLQRQQQFIVDNVGGYREGGTIGDYSQVDIGGQLGAARDAIAGIKGVDLGGMQIRNADDMQAAADLAVQQGAGKGGKFYRREGGRNVYIENPAIIDVLQKGRMNDREIGDVARALFAVEAARRQNVNQTKKELFAEGMGQVSRPVDFGGNHPALGGGAAQIDMVRGQKVEGKDVRAQLQALDGRKGNPGEPLDAGELAQARMPFQGAVKGEGAPRAAFVRGADRGLSEEQLIAKHGPANGKIAAQVIRRFEQQEGTKPDGFGAPLQRNEVPMEAPRMDADMLNTLAELNSAGKPEQGPYRPLTEDLREQLFSLPNSAADGGGSGGGDKRRLAGYMSEFDGPNNQAKGYASRAGRPFEGVRGRWDRAGRNQKTAAVVGGAVLGTLGLDALIGGEKEKRQQEGQYQ